VEPVANSHRRLANTTPKPKPLCKDAQNRCKAAKGKTACQTAGCEYTPQAGAVTEKCEAKCECGKSGTTVMSAMVALMAVIYLL